MRDFICPKCGQHLAFENSLCLSCHSSLGFSLDDMTLLVIASGEEGSQPGFVDSDKYELCANLHLAECNWLVEKNPVRRLCTSCVLTRTRPNDADTKALAAFAESERAKRRLIAELFELKLDLAEGDDLHREQLRIAMDEPYRTLLGHFRHEIGHYYYYRLVSTSQERTERFRELYGDAEADYQAALDQHYQNGPPADWEESYVSSYATMHPAEDWAETFAHYLHIRDTLDTAAAFSIAPAAATFERKVLGPSGFDQIIDMWLPLSWSLNMINRSMGKHDLYPFVLPPAVLEKMRFIHSVVEETTADF